MVKPLEIILTNLFQHAFYLQTKTKKNNLFILILTVFTPLDPGHRETKGQRERPPPFTVLSFVARGPLWTHSLPGLMSPDKGTSCSLKPF